MFCNSPVDNRPLDPLLCHLLQWCQLWELSTPEPEVATLVLCHGEFLPSKSPRERGAVPTGANIAHPTMVKGS